MLFRSSWTINRQGQFKDQDKDKICVWVYGLFTDVPGDYIKKPMCKAELRQFIDQVSFMIDDITLFLDTHPDCREAIDAYNHFKMMRCEAVSDYVKQYGPLNRYDVDTCDDWNVWIDGPWPWEGACGC